MISVLSSNLKQISPYLLLAKFFVFFLIIILWIKIYFNIDCSSTHQICIPMHRNCSLQERKPDYLNLLLLLYFLRKLYWIDYQFKKKNPILNFICQEYYFKYKTNFFLLYMLLLRVVLVINVHQVTFS